jgi:hypothetical protein
LDSASQFDVFVVHLIRDGRGQVNSALRHHPQKTAEQASWDWVREIQRERKVLRRWAGNSLTLKYEALCVEPLKQVRKLFDFVDLDQTIDFLRFREFEHHVMGNSMRLREDSKVVNKELWRSQLSLSQLKDFNGVAGDLNRELGYA